MSLVFKTPTNAKNTTTRDSQNIDSPTGCTLVEGSAEYTENGEYTLAPEEADGFSSVSNTVDVPSDVNNQEKIATPTTSSQEVTPDSGYTGLSKVTVSAVTAAIDVNITAGNIKRDVEILGVTGNYDPQPDLEAKTVNSSTVQQIVTPTAGKDGLSSVTVEPYTLQAKSATPTTSQQVIEPDNDKDGLSSVTVAAVTSAIDANIAAGNIKKDVTILGVTGTYEGSGGGGCIDWASIGWNCNDLGWLSDGVAYSKTIIDSAIGGEVVNVLGDDNLMFVRGGMYNYSPGSGAFSGCNALLQAKDVSVRTSGYNADFTSLFSSCYSLKQVGNVTFLVGATQTHPTSLYSAFKDCFNLISIPSWDYSTVTNFGSFLGATATALSGNLRNIPLMNMSSATDVSDMFKLKQPRITDGILGFQYLGKAFTGSSSSSHTLNLQYMENLTRTSVMNVINNLSAPDDTTATNMTLKLYSAVYNLLSAEDIAIATAKNWSVTSA